MITNVLQTGPAADLEASLQEKIEPWLQHMRWRVDYAEWREKRLWQENFQLPHLKALRKYASRPLAHARVLDLGSGMGGFAVALSRETGACVIGSDPNFAYNEITVLRGKRYQIELPALTAFGEALPFASKSFEVVTAWDVIEHVQDPAAVLRECARVLKPTGRLFVTVINRFALRDPHYHLLLINYLPRWVGEQLVERMGREKTGRGFQDRQRLTDMHYYTLGQFASLAFQAGFAVSDERKARVMASAASGRRGRLLAQLARFGILAPLYGIYSAAVMGTYELMLEMVSEEKGEID